MLRRDVLRAATAAIAGAGALVRPGAATATSLLRVFGKPDGYAKRVFVAGPPAAVLLCVLAPERLLGWPMRLSDVARSMLPLPACDRPVLGRLAGRGSTVTTEALLGLRPDLILDVGTVDGTYASAAERVARQTGLPYLLVDGRLADSARQLREVGEFLGVQTRAAALADEAKEVLESTGRHARQATPGVYLARGADGLETALAGSINGEVIEVAGGHNVASAGAGRGGIGRVSMEQLLAWAPDWVVTQDRTFYHRARADSLWRTLGAVREGRLMLLPDEPFGWLDGPPGVNRLLGLRWLAARLRGQPVTADGTLALAQRFYQLFYGVNVPAGTLKAQFDGDR